MALKIIFKCFCGFIAIIGFIACEGNSIEGEWVEPVPGMENQVQGINLEKGGKAFSINMATLKYESWEKNGNQLILCGKSIGNHETISFSDTLIIDNLTNISVNSLLRVREGGANTLTVNHAFIRFGILSQRCGSAFNRHSKKLFKIYFVLSLRSLSSSL